MTDVEALALIVFLVGAAVWSVTIAIVAGIIASQKHRSVVGWGLLSFFLMPTILILLALPSRISDQPGSGLDDIRHMPDEI